MKSESFPVLNFQDFIAADGDKLTTDTLKVAAVHGKRHNDVLRLVRQRIEEAGEWGLRNFAQSSYANEQGKEQPLFLMTKLGYAFLAGKLTGKKAVQHQIAFITAFDDMERYIKNQREGLQYRFFELQIEHRGKKEKASFHGRGLNEWKGEKPVLETAMQAITEKMNPQLELVQKAA